MNIVYLIEFVDRKEKNEKPYFYIGSKSNCVIRDGIMYGTRKKEYWGSSKDKEMLRLIPTEQKIVHILFSDDDYNICLNMEKTIHIERDVVADPKYFNKSVAMCNNYSNPEYATYRNVETGKVARLDRNHEKVLNGEWVGVTKGVKYSEERRMKSSRPGELHPLYGTKSSEETKKKISEAHIKNHQENPELYKQRYEELSNINRDRTKGIKQDKSVVDKRVVKLKNNITLQNNITGEKKTFKNNSEEYEQLDKTIWVHLKKGYATKRNIITGEYKDFLKSSDEYKNLDKTVWVSMNHKLSCRKNIETFECKLFDVTSEEYKNLDKSIWILVCHEYITLKNKNTLALKKFNKFSEEFKILDRDIWVGVKFNTVFLINKISGIRKMFDKSSEEYKNLILDEWISGLAHKTAKEE